VLSVVVPQDHRGEQIDGLPVLIRGDRDSLRRGQPLRGQLWPTSAASHGFAHHASTVSHDRSNNIIPFCFHPIGWVPSHPDATEATHCSLPAR
jgi:hypothetical protein